MCGIVGYVGPRQAAPIVMDGLKRLEYRGYDSAGIVVLNDGKLAVRRDVGKLANLEAMLAAQPISGTIGMGHTRWATHGKPSRGNAHPHVDCTGEIVVIHNGIVENYRALKQELVAKGHRFASETDTEVIVHLVEEYARDRDLASAARLALGRIDGAHAIVIMSAREPDRLVAARLGNAGGVTIGLGDGETFVASDMPAILEHTRRVFFLESGELAVVKADGAIVFSAKDEVVHKRVTTISFDPLSAAKGEYRHFMQKEIFEQPRAVTDTIRGRVDFETGQVTLAEAGIDAAQARSLQRVVIVACGTSYYSALVGKFMIERLARLPVEVDYGSEFRYREPFIGPNTLVVSVTQSGETVDTLAAMEQARLAGARQVTIVNVLGSQASRVAEGTIYMQAGPEICVASTKAFTTSLVDLFLLSLYLGQQRGTVSAEESMRAAGELAALPKLMGETLVADSAYQGLARQYADRHDFLFLGRGVNYPVALEGALKLKEISYIHAEGYPAGEMKHGPIALVDPRMPVVALAVRDSVYDKMVSNIEQVKARDGIVIAVGTAGDEHLAAKADHVIWVPPAPALLAPAVTVMPLQLLAYHVAVLCGRDVDQPRNLAKSVTVE